MTTLPSGICGWLNVAFDGGVRDERDLIQTEFGGRTLYIKPNGPPRYPSDPEFVKKLEWADLIAVFLEANEAIEKVQLIVNRFLSAWSWRDQIGYATLGEISSGASCDDRDRPKFTFGHPRVRWDGHIGTFSVDSLPLVSEEEQLLALALYRDGLVSGTDFYQFLSYYKIINIRYPSGDGQIRWINANLSKIGSREVYSLPRLKMLIASGDDVGDYLYKKGRCAIAHASYSSGDPIRDPDDPQDVLAIGQDIHLVKDLARIFIEEELGVPR